MNKKRKQRKRVRRIWAVLLLAALLPGMAFAGAGSASDVFAEENTKSAEESAAAAATGEAAGASDAADKAQAANEAANIMEDDLLTPEELERDYTKVMYDSVDGLDGSDAISLCADRNGILWVGSYTGLYRYDGYELQEMGLTDPVVGVTAIIQDQSGRIWAGTNGDGIFIREDEDFLRAAPDRTEINSIHAMAEDGDNIIFAATTQGVYRIELSEKSEPEAEDAVPGTPAGKPDPAVTGKTGPDAAAEKPVLDAAVTPVTGLEGIEVRDLTVVADGNIVAVTSAGEVYLIREMTAEKYDISGSGFNGEMRCVDSDEEQGVCYLGSGENVILKYSWEGEYLDTITCEDLSSFNSINTFSPGQWWVCSDAGIGLLELDTVRKINFPMNDSVEACCVDYQGGFWFASSRQGLMKVYRNRFSNLGAYFDIEDITVNAVFEEGKALYLGCDGGLLKFQNGEKKEDDLTRACEGMRIRHIGKDRGGNLWISTYRDGIASRRTDGELVWYREDNSELTTNKIRCTEELADGLILVGTDDGLFGVEKDGTLSRYTTGGDLEHIRVMTILEESDGTIYAGTDGYGIYVIKDHETKRIITKKDGLATDIVMRLAHGRTVPGTWVVTGAGICYYDPADGSVRQIRNMTIANSLDLLIREDGKAVVLAGNGVFVLDEKELLDENDLAARHYSRQEGLPVDITANSWNAFVDDEVMICGSGGLTCMHMDYEHSQKNIALYIAGISADGKPVGQEDGVWKVGASTERLTLDIRPLIFNDQAVRVGQQLVGQDTQMRFSRAIDLQKNEYTNLRGGTYRYVVTAMDPVTQEEMDSLEIEIQKGYHFWEIPIVRVLAVVLGLIAIGMLGLLIVRRNSKRLHGHYQGVMEQEREELMTRMRYRDVATGVYNRDMFEIEKKSARPENLFAVLTVSLNNTGYIRRKYSSDYETELLSIVASDLRERMKNGAGSIFRVNEEVFVVLVHRQMDLDAYIAQLRKKMHDMNKNGDHLISIAAGMAYPESNPESNPEKRPENWLDDLLNRSDELCRLDAALEEGRFMDQMIDEL